MNTKKIEVLEKAVQMLENGFNYSWFALDRCNCGLLVQATGFNKSYLEYSKATNVQSWRFAIKDLDNKSNGQDRCSVTGLYFSDVQRILRDLGFTASELCELEFLGNPQIAEKIGWITHKTLHGNELLSDNIFSKSNLLKYLRAWIELLREEDAKESPEVKERIVYVAVPVSITEQTKELILS